MDIEISIRSTARWLGLLAVLGGAFYLAWQTASLLKQRSQLHPRTAAATAAAPPMTVRIGNVDQGVLLGRIIGSEGVNEQALAEIEGREPSLTAAAEFVAARYEHEHNHDEQALHHIQQALTAEPANAGLHAWCASLMLNSGNTVEALKQAEQAGRLEPESADVQRINGLVYYQAGRLPEAIEAWEHSLRLAQNPGVSEYLEKARREAAVEEHFTENARGHFVLRYEGGHPAEALSDDLWNVMERDYDALYADLGFAPKAPITVVLYSAQQFSDVTQAPAWAGAINDGKLRIPVGDLRTVTPQLESVLRHELTHSFVHSAAPQCPAWLNEGLAQMEESKSVDALPADLKQAARSGGFVPLEQLEGTFQQMNPQEAQRAYVESLAAVEYVRSAEGMEGLRRLLGKLSEGEQSGVAMRAVSVGGYAELDRETEAYMAKHGAADSR
jgi:tetratricopeptide (TPR) repeat protein